MSDWSPYGLERYRTAGSNRRTAWVLVALGVLVAVWLLANFAAQNGTVELGVGGKEGTIALKPPEEERPTPTTVSIAPGRVQSLDHSISESGASAAARTSVGTEDPYPLVAWAILFGPFLLLPWLARKLLTRPAKTELNFGVYKGAMPLEMISASQRDAVHSRRAVEEPLFGRSRRDYIQDEG